MSLEQPEPPKKPLLGEEWKAVKLGQIHKLIQIGEYGKLSRELWGTDPATFSREISRLENWLGVKLSKTTQGDSTLTPEGKLLTDLFSPWINLCARISDGEIANLKRKQLRMGAGGSLAAWLIGARLPEVKGTFRDIHGKDSPAVSRTPRVEIQALRNRDTLFQVAAGALDCGLVRSGVIKAARVPIKKIYLGTVRYMMYVPQAWLPEVSKKWSDGEPMPQEFERGLLSSQPLATVGPHGEFYRELDAALYDRGLFPNIEYLYRAFPMLLPHMHMKTHVTLMPDIRVLEGNSKDTSEVAGYRKFPLGILSGYRREIYFVYSPDHATIAPDLDPEALAKILQFGNDPEPKCDG